jgi:flagellar protein FliL
MAKPAAASKKAADDSGAAPKSSKKKLIMIIVGVLVLIAGGVVAFLLLKPPAPTKHSGTAAKVSATAAVEEAVEDEKAHPETAAKFVDLGQFTANLIREDEDRYIQIAISLKISKPELEEKIKETKPEILHRVNMLLQNKKPSQLATIEGKERLVNEIKAQAEYVLGLRKVAPPIENPHAGASAVEIPPARSGISEVLFTSFIIQ